MIIDRVLRLAGLAFGLVIATSGCASSSAPNTPETKVVARDERPRPKMTVHKSPTCDCCRRWAEHAQRAGFTVEIADTVNLDAVKSRLGVPAPMASCHTVEVGGYLIEGHVPIEDVLRLLDEQPDARGLALPGMPLGSPGMEVPAAHVQPYVVYLISPEGVASEFARHGTHP